MTRRGWVAFWLREVTVDSERMIQRRAWSCSSFNLLEMFWTNIWTEYKRGFETMLTTSFNKLTLFVDPCWRVIHAADDCHKWMFSGRWPSVTHVPWTGSIKLKIDSIGRLLPGDFRNKALWSIRDLSSQQSQAKPATCRTKNRAEIIHETSFCWIRKCFAFLKGRQTWKERRPRILVDLQASPQSLKEIQSRKLQKSHVKKEIFMFLKWQFDAGWNIFHKTWTTPTEQMRKPVKPHSLRFDRSFALVLRTEEQRNNNNCCGLYMTSLLLKGHSARMLYVCSRELSMCSGLW